MHNLSLNKQFAFIKVGLQLFRIYTSIRLVWCNTLPQQDKVANLKSVYTKVIVVWVW